MINSQYASMILNGEACSACNEYQYHRVDIACPKHKKPAGPKKTFTDDTSDEVREYEEYYEDMAFRGEENYMIYGGTDI